MRELKDETYIGEIERLFRRINYIIFRKGRNVLSDFGITPPQFSTLSTVSYHDGITMGELCDHLFLTSATVTALVDRLEERGLLFRDRDKEDRRVIRLHITQEGRHVLEESLKTRRALFATYLEGLNAEEREQLKELLEKLFANIVGKGKKQEDK